MNQIIMQQNLNQICFCEICQGGKHRCHKLPIKHNNVSTYKNHYLKREIQRAKTQKKQEKYQPKHYDPNQMKSNYQDQYKEFTLQKRVQSPFQIMAKNHILPESRFEGESSYNNSFKPYSGNYNDLHNKIVKNQNKLENGRFEGQSTYKLNYQGQKGVKAQKFRPIQQIVTDPHKFTAESTYNLNYLENALQLQPKAQRPKSKKDLIKMDNNFNGVSSYNSQYIGQGTKRVQKIVPKGEIFLGDHIFEGSTNYLRDYNSKTIQRRQPIINSANKNIFPEGNFEGNSTYKNHYNQKYNLN